MPGKIVKIMAEVGGDVREKQALVIVEAMKMENPVLARAKGKVKAIHFAVGDQVDTESPIIELELEEG
jgi:biotin carboxyl carrier protein